MRYLLQKSTTQDGWWTITDTETQLVCRFKEHEFNETQNFTFLDDDAEVIVRRGVNEIARIVNSMTEWGIMHHYNILMPE